MSDLATLLRATRMARGLTLDQAAEQLGVNRMTVYRWEHGLMQFGGAARKLVEMWTNGL